MIHHHKGYVKDGKFGELTSSSWWNSFGPDGRRNTCTTSPYAKVAHPSQESHGGRCCSHCWPRHKLQWMAPRPSDLKPIKRTMVSFGKWSWALAPVSLTKRENAKAPLSVLERPIQRVVLLMETEWNIAQKTWAWHLSASQITGVQVDTHESGC